MFSIELGSKVRDRVTGLSGVVVGRHEYLYGCRRYSIQPLQLHEGKRIEVESFDEDALEVTEAAEPHKVKETGGPQRDPMPRKDPVR